MSEWPYIRKRADLSWHIVRTPTRMFNDYVTLCGRRIETTLTRETLPGDEKTCERCFVLRAKLNEDDGSTWTESVP